MSTRPTPDPVYNGGRARDDEPAATESAPELAAIESAPEPAAPESAPEPAATESAPDPAAIESAHESAPEPAAFRSFTESAHVPPCKRLRVKNEGEEEISLRSSKISKVDHGTSILPQEESSPQEESQYVSALEFNEMRKRAELAEQVLATSKRRRAEVLEKLRVETDLFNISRNDVLFVEAALEKAKTRHHDKLKRQGESYDKTIRDIMRRWRVQTETHETEVATLKLLTDNTLREQNAKLSTSLAASKKAVSVHAKDLSRKTMALQNKTEALQNKTEELHLFKTEICYALNKLRYTHEFHQHPSRGIPMCPVSQTMLMPSEPVVVMEAPCSCNCMIKTQYADIPFRKFHRGGEVKCMTCNTEVTDMVHSTVEQAETRISWRALEYLTGCDDYDTLLDKRVAHIEKDHADQTTRATKPYRDEIARHEIHAAQIASSRGAVAVKIEKMT